MNRFPALMVLPLLFVAWPMRAGCDLRSQGEGFEGACIPGIVELPTAIRLESEEALTTGPWRADRSPTSVWAGETAVGDYSPTPVELEVYDDGSGVLRTLFGWFPVSGVETGPATLSFELDPTREVEGSGLDRAIVQRAAEILSTDATWDRADDRECEPDPAAWSLFCAMRQATVDVTGAFHHRRPALQVVRVLVDERSVDRDYAHRLQDYNNDPSTRLEDVHELLREAVRRLEAGGADGG